MIDFTIGAFGASIIISILLRLIYNTFVVSNKWKPWIAIIIGVGLGVLALFYSGDPRTIQLVVDYCVKGFMTGATAVGLYEITQKKEAPPKK